MSDEAAKENTMGLISREREKKWDECGIEEKVERLRRELLNQRWQVRQGYQNAEALQEHAHSATGEIVVPLHRKRGQGESAGTPRDPLA